MIRHSFFSKLFLGNLVLVGVIVGIAGVVSYQRLNATYLSENEAHQERTVRIARQYFEHRWGAIGGKLKEIDAECKELLVGSEMRLTVIAADGRVLGDSEANAADMENHKTPDRPEVLDALVGREGRHVRDSETLGVRFRYLGQPIYHDGKVVGVARVAMPVRTIAHGQGLIRASLLWAAVAAVAVAVMLALLLSWIWYAPLREITRTARTLASGDLSRRADISGSDELAQLGTALNEMGQSIAAKIRQIATQQENLVAVVQNLREGVIGTDRDGRIILMNRAATDLLAAEAGEATGQPLQTVVRIPEIVDVFDDATAASAPVSRQLELQIQGRARSLDVHASRLTDAPAEAVGVLLVVRDVTDLVRTAAIKAEFVANASHELRTPLATIRAAVDSLSGIGPGDRDELARLADILDRHTTRLEDMASDLLSLHLVESAQKASREPIELGALAAWVEDHFAQPAGEKDISLRTECSDPDEEIESDLTLLQLILQNLVENAIKFTDAGGEVHCRLAADAERVVIGVRDTGCGIAPEIQPRVFERFFQADPARSGEPRARGTGLGLAIVKHAADRLAAEVKLESAPGRGTTVTVTFPLHGGT